MRLVCLNFTNIYQLGLLKFAYEYICVWKCLLVWAVAYIYERISCVYSCILCTFFYHFFSTKSWGCKKYADYFFKYLLTLKFPGEKLRVIKDLTLFKIKLRFNYNIKKKKKQLQQLFKWYFKTGWTQSHRC